MDEEKKIKNRERKAKKRETRNRLLPQPLEVGWHPALKENDARESALSERVECLLGP